MRTCQDVYIALDDMEIDFDVVEHPPALTTEDANNFIEGKEGARTKTLFLNNRKKTKYYLVVMNDTKRVDMKKLRDILNESGVSFSSSERLMEKMQLPPGIVSIFGLLNNKRKDITVCFEREILSESRVTFHANDNTKTVFISPVDMYKFVNQLGFEYTVIDL